MEISKIIEKERKTKLDRLTCWILSGVSKLHDENIPMKDMKIIKKAMNEVWRKHHPLHKINNNWMEELK